MAKRTDGRVPQLLVSIIVILMFVAACGKAGLGKPRSPAPSDASARYERWASRQPRPPEQLVARIEALLSRQPCVGPLEHWSRSYAYDLEGPKRALYRRIVAFHLESAGVLGIRPGRQTTAPLAWVDIDDRPIRVVDGDYDLADGRLRIGYCGNNLAPPRREMERFDRYRENLQRRRSTQLAIQTD